MAARRRSQRLNGLFPLSYTGVVPVSPVNFVIEQRQPTTQDFKNFYTGDLWLDVGTNVNLSSRDVYMLVDAKQNIATWINFGAGGDLETLTGDSGGPVTPLAQNIDVLGDAAAGLTTIGNPGAHSITVSTISGGPFLQTLTGDAGPIISPDGSGNIDIITENTTVEFTGSANQLELDFGIDNILIGTEVLGITGTQNIGLGKNVLSVLTSGDDNIAIGDNAGEFINTGSRNVLAGKGAGQDLTDGNDNIAIGFEALEQPVGSGVLRNIAIGSRALRNTDGNENVAVGYFSGLSLNTGSSNILLGSTAGSILTGTDSRNIDIGNVGVPGDNDTIRIGEDGVQTSCYIAGIAGVTVSNQETVTIDTTTGQLGSTASGGGGNANAFYAEQQNNTAGAVSTLTAGSYPGGNTMGITDGPMVEIYDPDNVFNPGDGMAVPASFTAPQEGIYSFNWSINLIPNGVSDFTTSALTLYFDNNGTFRRVNVTRLPSVGGGIIRDGMSLNTTLITFMSVSAVMTFKFGATASPVTGTFTYAAGPPTQVGNWISGFRIA